MTVYKPILISNYKTGLERDLEPWILPNDAFPELLNTFIFRGRIRRKLGVHQIGRLGVFSEPATLNPIGTHNAGPPQTFGPFTFTPVPIGRSTVFITDEQFIAPVIAPSATYVDDGLGNLIANFSTTVPPVPVTITNITQAASAVITVASHPFSIGDQVWLTDVQGMTQINQQVMGVGLTVTGTSPTTITVAIDSTAFDAYTGGGQITWFGGTVDYTTGVFTVTFYTPPNLGPVTATANHYPCRPVMGLTLLDTPFINREQLVAFDTVKAYRFDATLQDFRDISFDTSVDGMTAPISWTGSDSDFFWSMNYANALFTTNFHQGDPIRFFAVNPVPIAPFPANEERWRPFQPPTSSTVPGDQVLTCRLMFSYRGRFVMINTIENVGGAVEEFPQRARWSQNGTPYYSVAAADTPPTPFAAQADAWWSNVNGKGGFADAPTREAAISAEFIDDNLVVFFERSTWLLFYTGDPNDTFVWQRVNVDLGSESTFSTIAFDKGVFSVGTYGIVSSDGNDTSRIDQKIPDEVFNFENKDEGVKRVHGIRDYSLQLAYWTFPNANVDRIFPNQVLVLNYVEQSYSIFDDSFTCFGQFQLFTDKTWADSTESWEDNVFTWGNPTGDQFDPQICAGNQQGFVLQVQAQPCPDPSLCLDAMSGTNPPIITSTNHNLETGQFVSLSGLVGTGDLAQFAPTPDGKIQIFKVIVNPSNDPANKFEIQKEDGSPFNAYTYTDSGEIIVLSNFRVLTKRFNLGLEEGRQTRIGFTDLYLDEDEDGEFELDLYVDEDDSNPLDGIVSMAAEPPTSLSVSKVWKRDYTSVIGQLFQYSMQMNDHQMFNPDTVCADFQLHAMIMWVTKAGRLTY